MASVYPKASHIDPDPFFSNPDTSSDKLFAHQFLNPPLRKYVIEKIKNPLRQALEKSNSFFGVVGFLFMLPLTAWKIKRHFGEVVKENTIFVMCHLLVDVHKKFNRLHNNPGRQLVFDSVFNIGKAVVGHDPYYEYIFRWLCWQIVDFYLKGKLPELSEPPAVLKPCWNKQLED